MNMFGKLDYPLYEDIEYEDIGWLFIPIILFILIAGIVISIVELNYKINKQDEKISSLNNNIKKNNEIVEESNTKEDNIIENLDIDINNTTQELKKELSKIEQLKLKLDEKKNIKDKLVSNKHLEKEKEQSIINKDGNE
tara:strand:+ start:395 stop:811 length:417 start_codon:yes stop_codon:yes gene_type:complete